MANPLASFTLWMEQTTIGYEQQEIIMYEELRFAARKPIDRMLEIIKRAGL